jgi:predicted aspartyl protease
MYYSRYMRFHCSLLFTSLILLSLNVPTLPAADFAPEIIHLVRDDQNHLFIPLSVDGIRSWWGIDTGFPFSVIDSSIASRANLRHLSDSNRIPLNADVNGRVCPIVEATNITVGSTNLGDLKVAALNLEVKPYERSEEVGPNFEMGGILGIDFLVKYNAIIDFQRKEIQISPPELPTDPAAISAGYQPVELESINHRRMEVLCRVGDFAYPFSIDTGSAGTSASIEIAKQNRIPLQARPYNSASIGAESTRTEFARVSDFQIGHFECGRVDLNFTASSKPEKLARGLLGADLLSKYGAILDVGRNALYLRQP